jgi:peptide chain release factor 1
MADFPQESHEPTALIRKLDQMAGRLRELEDQLNDPAVFGNAQKLVTLSKERGQIEPVVGRYADYQKARRQVEELRELSAGGRDAEMAELAAAELPEAEAKASAMLEALKDEFVAAEANAVDSFFVEIRAGTGGE